MLPAGGAEMGHEAPDVWGQPDSATGGTHQICNLAMLCFRQAVPKWATKRPTFGAGPQNIPTKPAE